MAYECKTLDTTTSMPVCTEWQETSLFPQLTNAERDSILLWTVTIFALVFAGKKILRLFS